MGKPIYYYVIPVDSEFWELHHKGCPVLNNSESKIFLGTLYSRGQAMTVARVRTGVSKVRFCKICLCDDNGPRRINAFLTPVKHFKEK